MSIQFNADGRLFLGNINTIPASTTEFSIIAIASVDIMTTDPRLIMKGDGTGTTDHDWALYGGISGGGGDNELRVRIRLSGTLNSEFGGAETLPEDGIIKAFGFGWDGGSTINMYVEDTLVAQPGVDGTVLSTNVDEHAIGDIPVGAVGQRPWDGKVLEVRIYTRFIDLTEFQAYHLSQGQVIGHEGLLHWWRFQGEEGTLITADQVNDLVAGALNGVSVDGTVPPFTSEGITRRRYL